MHEGSIAQSILDIVQEEMARHKIDRVEAVNISVGKLSAIVPISLTTWFEILTKDTNLEGVTLNIREIPLGYHCFECGRRFEAEEMAFACPHCRAEGPILTDGRDMTVESIEVAD